MVKSGRSKHSLEYTKIDQNKALTITMNRLIPQAKHSLYYLIKSTSSTISLRLWVALYTDSLSACANIAAPAQTQLTHTTSHKIRTDVIITSIAIARTARADNRRAAGKRTSPEQSFVAVVRYPFHAL
jgi:hypothetical protein